MRVQAIFDDRRGTLSCRIKKERLRTLRTGLSVPAGIKKAFRQVRIPRWLQAFVAQPAAESGLHRKNGRPETCCSRFFDVSCSYNASDGFFLGDVFLSRCHRSLHAHR